MNSAEETALVHKCFVCRSPSLNRFFNGGALEFQVDCTRCGKYRILSRTTLVLKGREFSDVQRANMSGFIRQNQGILIEDGDLEFLESLRTPKVAEKALKLLLQIVREHPAPGEGFMINYWVLPNLLKKIEDDGQEEYAPDLQFTKNCRSALYWLAVSWTKDVFELEFLLRDYLKDTKGILDDWKVNGYYVIMPGGWDYLEILSDSGNKSNSGFVAMWFDPSVHPAWLGAIGPGVQDAGYEAIRIDTVEHNNRIDDEIVAAIRACRFLVADFTGQRGGVYYEAGLAHGLGKQVVWLCRDDELNKVHFDTRQYNFILWSPNRLSELRTKLRHRIEATLGKGTFRK